MARRPEAVTRPSAYDSLIDAERAALIQAGQTPTRHNLTAALIEATGLSSREARRAVARFIEDRGGFVPTTTPTTDAQVGWIDGLLDAERANARRDDRLVSRRTMIRAVRQASPTLTARQAHAAVADYLYRRGGRTPRARGRWVVALVLLGLVAILAVTWMLLHR